jgi:3-hydroxybutyryl-CoA dehydrogenase
MEAPLDMPAQPTAIHQVAVIGAGLMGHAIAQEFAANGFTVWLHDRTEQELQSAGRNVENNLALLHQLGLLSSDQIEAVRANLHTTTDLQHAATDADLVIEAVFEDLPLKQRIFGELDLYCPKHTILASNTSSFLPSLLAGATGRPDKVLVAHYFNPPHLLPLVELVRGEETSEATVTTMHVLLTGIGKKPVVVQKEVFGFVGNRLQMALLREALSLVDQGVASAADVDAVVRYGFGRRLAAAGPFEVFEIAGWDLVHAVAAQILPVLDPPSEVPPLLVEKVEHGELGLKCGRGFYDWTPERATALRERIGRALIDVARRQGERTDA